MLVEDTRQGDWLRTGRQGIAELLIAYELKSVCKLAALMKENGQTGAPIYKEVVEMCEEKRKKLDANSALGKGIIYVRDPSKAPPGVKVTRGPRGGVYYNVNDKPSKKAPKRASDARRRG